METETKKVIFTVIWILGIFLVAGVSTYKWAYTTGFDNMKVHADEFIYENCTCQGFTTRTELIEKEKEKYYLPEGRLNFTMS